MAQAVFVERSAWHGRPALIGREISAFRDDRTQMWPWSAKRMCSGLGEQRIMRHSCTSDSPSRVLEQGIAGRAICGGIASTVERWELGLAIHRTCVGSEGSEITLIY